MTPELNKLFNKVKISSGCIKTVQYNEITESDNERYQNNIERKW